jgi:tRNA dimethylallyltransferase
MHLNSLLNHLPMKRKVESAGHLYSGPTIVITGPTASGKTALAVELAKQYGGEIISADSRAVYKHMDIGTAKPTADEQSRVKHWGIDLVEPNESFTVYDFKNYALAAIDDIRGRGKIPFVVGGTGLYVDALIYDYHLGVACSSLERQKLEKLTVDELQELCKQQHIPLPENNRNKRYLIRQIELRGKNNNDRTGICKDYVVVYITTDKDELRQRIAKRAEQMFDAQIVKETTYLTNKYDWSNEAMKANIYPIVQDMIDGKLTLIEAKQKFFFADWHLAKRQITWFKRNNDLLRLDLNTTRTYLKSLLD